MPFQNVVSSKNNLWELMQPCVQQCIVDQYKSGWEMIWSWPCVLRSAIYIERRFSAQYSVPPHKLAEAVYDAVVEGHWYTDSSKWRVLVAFFYMADMDILYEDYMRKGCSKPNVVVKETLKRKDTWKEQALIVIPQPRPIPPKPAPQAYAWPVPQSSSDQAQQQQQQQRVDQAQQVQNNNQSNAVVNFHHHTPSADEETKELLRQFEKKLAEVAEHVKGIHEYHKAYKSYGVPGGAESAEQADGPADGPGRGDDSSDSEPDR